MFTNCSWLVHNLPISCSKIITLLKFLQLRLVHVLFSTCSHFDYYLFMTCSWFVNDFFTTCSWLVHYLFITWSQFITLLKFLDLFMTCSGLAIDLLLNIYGLFIDSLLACSGLSTWLQILHYCFFTTCSRFVQELFTTCLLELLHLIYFSLITSIARAHLNHLVFIS